MPWYSYHRGGWQIAVDAMNQRDAAKFMAREVPDAVYDGPYDPPTTGPYSVATAFVTPRRQEIISAKVRKMLQELGLEE